MPVVVVGADTPQGAAVVAALRGRGGEIRAFVSDDGAARRLRGQGLKVALGDVSDASHVGIAAVGCFSAVLVSDASRDARERAFAAGPAATRSQWAVAMRQADVQRVIWVGEADDGEIDAETVVVGTAGRSDEEVAREVARLDEAAEL